MFSPASNESVRLRSKTSNRCWRGRKVTVVDQAGAEREQQVEAIHVAGLPEVDAAEPHPEAFNADKLGPRDRPDGSAAWSGPVTEDGFKPPPRRRAPADLRDGVMKLSSRGSFEWRFLPSCLPSPHHCRTPTPPGI